MNLLKFVPARLFFSLLVLIAVTEAILMMTVNIELEAARIPVWLRAVTNAGLLALICTPFLISHYLRLLRVAYHDNLTGLPNRILFHDRLNQGIALAKRGDSCCALIFMDLDHFKPVNDTYGHHVGDQVLKLVADRLRQCIRESDMVARLGGDEFTIILPQITGKNDVEMVVKKIIAGLSQPFDVHEHHLQLDVSVGIAIYPDNGNNADLLLKAADEAMYRAKSDGGSAYCLAEKAGC
ncbi:MAG: GGDEF domain-containing protein [Gallionella sp.]|nr:GGDEF domain-containing protein [Gallionella sp.]